MEFAKEFVLPPARDLWSAGFVVVALCEDDGEVAGVLRRAGRAVQLNVRNLQRQSVRFSPSAKQNTMFLSICASVNNHLTMAQVSAI